MSQVPVVASVKALVGVEMVFLLFPVMVVVVISFSALEFLTFPPPAYSLRWYRAVLDDPGWISAFLLTLQVASLTTILSCLIGVPAGFAMARHLGASGGLFSAVMLSALITPPIIKAISLYLYFVPLGLVNTVAGLAFAHTVSGLPFVFLNVTASLKNYDTNLERAAIVHGASPVRAVLGITLPIIGPGIFVGAVFAFLQSAQELLVSLFILGTVRKPLSVKLWESVRESVDPTVAAASTAVIAIAVLGFAAAAAATRDDQKG
jgi:ABC-type spermidine/putrescine transport system permease subunit II